MMRLRWIILIAALLLAASALVGIAQPRLGHAAVEAGSNSVSGPMLSRSDDDALYRDALRSAVANAKDKAEALASAAGLTLGGAETIVEGGQSSPPISYTQKADAAGVSVPIEPGTQTIEASVTVTYDAG